MKSHVLEELPLVETGHNIYTVREGEVVNQVTGVTTDPAAFKAFDSIM